MTDKPIILLDPSFEQFTPDTGWRCSVCFDYAQVMMAGESMCVKHAKEWQHGYGKSIKEMRDALPYSTLT